MNQLVRISVAAFASVIVCAAMGVGVWWLFSALPAPTDLHDNPTPPPSLPSNDVPRLAVIPWKRDPAHLAPVRLTPAWFPWEKPPKPLRPVLAWWQPPPTLPRPHTDTSEIDSLAAALKSPDLDTQNRALARIEEIIRTDPIAAARPLAGLNQVWSAPLIAAKRWADLDHLAEELLLPCAYNTDLLDGLFADRTAAAVAQHQPDAALLHYRQWFAVCPLRSTANVLAQTEQALRLASTNPKQTARDFRASIQTATTETAPSFSMKLDPNTADSDRFAKAAADLHAEDYASLLTRANLFLLAGLPDRAEPLFRRAYMLAPDPQLPAATENLARVIKAKTGSIPATNAWIKEHTE